MFWNERYSECYVNCCVDSKHSTCVNAWSRGDTGKHWCARIIVRDQYEATLCLISTIFSPTFNQDCSSIQGSPTTLECRDNVILASSFHVQYNIVAVVARTTASKHWFWHTPTPPPRMTQNMISNLNSSIHVHTFIVQYSINIKVMVIMTMWTPANP